MAADRRGLQWGGGSPTATGDGGAHAGCGRPRRGGASPGGAGLGGQVPGVAGNKAPLWARTKPRERARATQGQRQPRAAPTRGHRACGPGPPPAAGVTSRAGGDVRAARAL